MSRKLKRELKGGFFNRSRQSKQSGAAIAELVVVLPALLTLGLGVLQSALFYQAKTTVTYATFEAARKGAVNHGQRGPMLEEFGVRMAPIFGGDGSAGEALSAMQEGKKEARNPALTELAIINPSQEAFLEFGVKNGESGKTEIPNTHLKFRDAEDIGAKSKVNVQDANLLKIKTTYGFDLKVPLMRSLLTTVLKKVDAKNARFYNQGRIPITAVATVRMHSAAWPDGNLLADGTAPTSGTVHNNHLVDPSSPNTGSNTSGNSNNTGQGGNRNTSGTITPIASDPFSSTNRPSSGPQCDASTTSCVSRPDNLGDPSCSAPGANPTSLPTQIVSTGTGNPIHVVSGNKYQEETDFAALPGPLGLVWQRHYNSQYATRGDLGAGWRHSYEVEVKRFEDGIRLIQADGRHLTFTERGERFESTLTSDGWLTASSNDVVWYWPSGQTFTFNDDGRVSAIALPTGQSLSLQYTPSGRLMLVRDAQNRELSIAYYSNGRIKQVLDASGQALSYRYDQYGNLSTVSFPDKSQRTYHYEDTYDRNNLTGITDQRGIRFATWSYDEHDRAISSEHAGGVEKVGIEYSEDGSRRVTNSLGEASTYYTEARSGLGVVTRIDGPGCSSCGMGDVQYEYDEQLRLTSIQERSGAISSREYDDQGRLLAVYKQTLNQPRRLVSRFGFDGNATTPTSFQRPSINPEGIHSISMGKDSKGNVVSITEEGYALDYDGGYLKMRRATRYEYNDEGQLISSDGPVPGAVDRIEYPVSTNKPPHPASADASSGRPRQVQANGKSYGLSYDTNHRLVGLNDGEGNVLAELRYDASGNMLGIKGGKGEATAEYDAAGRVIQAKGAQGQLQTWQWNTEGQLLNKSSQNEQGEVITEQQYAYNALNQLSMIIHMDGSAENFEYSATEKLSSYTNTQGKRTDYRYNENGLLEKTTHLANTASAVSEAVKYDIHGNVVERTDARGNTSYWAYDDFGHLLYKSNPDKGLTMYRYDASGNVIARVDEGGIIARFDYNDAGQLIGIAPFDKPATTTFEYSAKGVPKKADGLNQTTEYLYSKGRVIEKRVHIKALAQSYLTRYERNEKGVVESVTLPGGQVLDYEYNKENGNQTLSQQGRLLDTDLLTMAVNGRGQIEQIDYSGSISTHYEYRDDGRLDSVSVDEESGSTLTEKEYAYTELGQVSKISTAGALGTAVSGYGYDLHGHLIEAEHNGKKYTWSYDSVGNRLSSKLDSASQTYRYEANSNRLAAANDEQVRYQRTGELAKVGDYRYEYTAGHRIRAVYKAGKLLAEYRYNADGERIQKIDHTNGAKETYYLYENKKLSAELDGKGEVKRQYVYADKLLVGLYDNKKFYAVHNNHLGAPEIVSDKQGNIVWHASYSPYGKATLRTEELTLNIRLPGQYFDHESGNHYNIYRTYNPETGRYLTSDPTGVAAGFNTYAYVKNDPLNRVDPLGLYDKLVHYYMTYFLAVTAGLSEEQALIVAQATQYVDDNWRTSPFTGVQGNALAKYHFTLDHDNGNGGDSSARRPDETEQEYALRRFRSPQSKQLDRLQHAALTYRDPCSSPGEPTSADEKYQLYGEFLHAFEDTFSHRDNRNRALPIFNTTGLIGHGTLGHDPDHTYNQFYTLSNPQGYWIYNETRTLQMEMEVYDLFVKDFGTTPRRSWEQLAGDGGAKLGTDGSNGFARFEHTPASGITGVLQEFNAYNERAHPDGEEAGEIQKVEILNRYLRDVMDLSRIPTYSKVDAANNRTRILEGDPLPDGLIEQPKND